MDPTDRLSSIASPVQPVQNNSRDASRTTEGPKQSEWEAHKEEIRALYQQHPLKEVKQILEDRGFVATQRMFKSRLAQWGFVKNSSDKEYQVAILLLQDRKAAGKHDTVFVINGHLRSVKDLRKYIKGRKMTDDEFTRLARKSEAAGELRGVRLHVRCGTPEPESSDADMLNHSPTSVSSLAESPPSPDSCLSPVDNQRSSGQVHNQIPHRTTNPHKSRRDSIKIRKNRGGRVASISDSAPGCQPPQMERVGIDREKSTITPGALHGAPQAFYTPRHSPSCDHFGIDDVDMLACSAVHSNPLPGTFGVDNQDALRLLNPSFSSPVSNDANLTCENCSPPIASQFAKLHYDSSPSLPGSTPASSSSRQSPRAILNPSDDVSMNAFQVAPSAKNHDYCSRWMSLCFLTCIYSTKHQSSPDDIQAKTLAQKSLNDAEREFEAILRSDDPMVVLTLNNALTILHQHNQSSISEKIMQSTAVVAERVVGVYSPIGIITRYLRYVANPQKLLQQNEITSQQLRLVWDEFVQKLPGGERDKRSIGALYCLGHLLNAEGIQQGNNQDKFRESASVLRQCYRLSCEILGPNNMQSIMALSGLRLSMEMQGDIKAAIGYDERAIQDSQLCLGTQHPKRLELMRNLARSYFQVGRDREAEALYWEVLEGRVKMLGSEHEYTHAIAYDLEEYLQQQNRWVDEKGEPTAENSRLEDFFAWDVVDPDSGDDEWAHNPLKETSRKHLKGY